MMGDGDDWKKDYEHGFDDAICHVRELLHRRINGDEPQRDEDELCSVRILIEEVNAVSDKYTKPGRQVTELRGLGRG